MDGLATKAQNITHDSTWVSSIITTDSPIRFLVDDNNAGNINSNELPIF